jgi:hypothetical protein
LKETAVETLKSEKPHPIPFKIDKTEHKINSDQNPVTGQFLRSLPPPVGDAYDLWLRSRGSEDDRIIQPQDHIEIQPGDHFYTAKKDIAPGG